MRKKLSFLGGMLVFSIYCLFAQNEFIRSLEEIRDEGIPLAFSIVTAI